jgi:hypothetical protein
MKQSTPSSVGTSKSVNIIAFNLQHRLVSINMVKLPTNMENREAHDKYRNKDIEQHP